MFQDAVPDAAARLTAGGRLMANRLQAVLTVLLLTCGWISGARAEEFRVSYAEPFQLQPTAPPAGRQKATTSHEERVDAFGRPFHLTLEDNGRLLRKVSARTQQQLSSVTLLRGAVKDVPGSWVRLTVRSGVYEGAIWDGNELYLIEPRARLEPALEQPAKGGSVQSLIYRLSDTQGGPAAKACAVDPAAEPINKPLSGYRGLINGLKTAMSAESATAAREIEVSMAADFEFTSQQSSGALGTMVSLMNIVDGIFGEQVGVAIVPTDFTAFQTSDDPFTQSDPLSLLNEVSSFRSSSEAFRSRGLTHLLTGRDLAGNTVGIAFVGALCNQNAGVGLSQSSQNMTSALVVAHEIGHNFGSQHDAEAGSPCATTPGTFIMSPTQNGSSTFSDCSLQSMQPHIAAASCIVNARIRDVALTVPAPEIAAQVNQSFEYVVDVSSVGEAEAGNVVLSTSLPGSLIVESASLHGVACPVTGYPSTGFTVNCELSRLAAGETRRLSIAARASYAGNLRLTTQASSTNDSVGTNNTASVAIDVAAPRDLRITATPQPLQVVVGQPFEMDVVVTASGTQPVEDVAVTFSGPPTILAITAPNGTCTLTLPVTCNLGTLAASEARQIRIQAVASNVGASDLWVTASAQTGATLIRSRVFEFTTLAERDISMTLTPASQRVAVGVDAPYSLQVRSNGVEAVDDVQVRIASDSPLVTLSIDGAVASSCAADNGAFLCNLGTVVAGAARTIQLRARSAQPVLANVSARVLLTASDDNTSNDLATSTLDIRNATDVYVYSAFPQTLYDQRPSSLRVDIASGGANSVDSVTASVSLPADFAIQVARVDGQLCSTQANVATCAVASMPSGSIKAILVEYTAPTPGLYAGSITVSAPGDANPANNSASIAFDVRPSVDGRIVVPASPRAITGQAVDMVFNVIANRHSLVDARFSLSWVGGLAEATAISQLGTCTIGGVASQNITSVTCDLGLVPANADLPITLRVRSATPKQVLINAVLSVADDVNFGDNFREVSLTIYDPGDASVSATASTANATTDQSFALPSVDVVALSEVAGAFVEFSFDQSLATLHHFAEAGLSCFFVNTMWRCELGNLAANETRRLTMHLTPKSAGQLPVTVRVGAANDTNAANDQRIINVTIQSAAPVTPPAPGGGGSRGGGGGGGGSMDWILAAVLCGLLTATCRSRFKRTGPKLFAASLSLVLLGSLTGHRVWAAPAYWRCGMDRIVVVTNSSAARCERLIRAVVRYEEILVELAGLEVDSALPPFTLYSVTREDAKRFMFTEEQLEEQRRTRILTYSKYLPGADDNAAAFVDEAGDESFQSILFLYGQGMLAYGPARSYPAWYQLGIANLLNGLVIKPDGTVLLNRNPMFAATTERGQRATQRLNLSQLLTASPRDFTTADFNELASRAHVWAQFGLLTTAEHRGQYRELALLMRQGTPLNEASQDAFGKPFPELDAEFESGRWRSEVSYRLPASATRITVSTPVPLGPQEFETAMKDLKARATE